MTLDDFEKSLAQEKRAKEQKTPLSEHGHSKRHRHHKYRHHREDRERHHRHKRRKLSEDDEEQGYGKQGGSGSPTTKIDGRETLSATLSSFNDLRHPVPSGGNVQVKRDSWMEQPSPLDIEYRRKNLKETPEPTIPSSSKTDFELKMHDNELNRHQLQFLVDGREVEDEHVYKSAQHEVSYTIGDAGSQWRMTKLKAVYRRAREEGRPIDDVAIEQFGDLRCFDDVREEHIELERRATYGEGYAGKEKPNGELFEERRVDAGTRKQNPMKEQGLDDKGSNARLTDTKSPPGMTLPMDQTALNRLKAQMLKAKIRGGSEVTRLEAEYNTAIASFANQKQPDVIVLGAMDNRMLASGRKGEVKAVETKRGRERGLVEENEDMTVEDMVREERRTGGQAGGDSRRFAERIAKDSRFDNDLDYMDENARKLAKRVQKSEINLKNTAISDFQRMNRILDSCPLCHHEDTNTPPVAPVVSLATRVYLTLPTEPEVSDGGACIIPVQHRNNLLECDDDEWEEIRNFMKSTTRMYHDQGQDVIFYENAAAPHRKKHAGMEVVPLPYSLGDTAPAFFREAIMTADEEWSQHRKIIDTLAKARNGLGKLAFRRALVREMPYFHVWFEVDGGLGHVIEDSNRWPKGDLFAREIIGGMLDKEPDIIKRQGRWSRGGDPRVDEFRKGWRKFDWTRVLTDD